MEDMRYFFAFCAGVHFLGHVDVLAELRQVLVNGVGAVGLLLNVEGLQRAHAREDAEDVGRRHGHLGAGQRGQATLETVVDLYQKPLVTKSPTNSTNPTDAPLAGAALDSGAARLEAALEERLHQGGISTAALLEALGLA
ncbi:hypothetical protein TYRP_002565 [Tyrophagus putrescentiae]|nr:hypothetical protein TYRP_002565 [Tyrophagus putrescentiae]